MTRTKRGNVFTRFADFWRRPQDEDLSKQRTTFTIKREMKGGLPANEKLLKGLYTGSCQEMALASYLSDGMVDVPKNMVGVPSIIPEQGQDDKLIKELMPLVVDEFPVLVTTMLTQGTAWRWARWSDELHRLTWEVIPDSSITSIIIELSTGEIKELYTAEYLEFNKGESGVATTTHKRHITKDLISEEWTGDINKKLEYKNTFGIMPVPFGHRCYENEWRGNSVYARVLRWMKAIHDIANQRDSILAEYEPKLVQTLNAKEGATAKWIQNNSTDNKEELDPFGRKLFLNQEGESTQYLFLNSDATAQHTQAIKDNELKVIKGSGIPELFFGALATGNHASTEADKLLALDHIKGIRNELTKGTQQLINQSLKILAFMRFTQPPQVSIQWGNLSLMSENQKAQIISAYASAIVPILNNKAISNEGAFYFTKKLFPDFPAENSDQFIAGLNNMGFKKKEE